MFECLNCCSKTCRWKCLFPLLGAVFKHAAIIQELSEMFMKFLSIGLFKYHISPSMFLLMEPFFSEIWETFKINMLIYPDGSKLASVRCVFSCLSVCHRVWWLRHFFVVLLFTPSFSLSLSHTTPPHPQTGHWWNAVPGILPQLAGRGAAAGWNMISPLSKHVFLHGCVQGRVDSGNASDREESSCGRCARFSLNGRSFDLLHPS